MPTPKTYVEHQDTELGRAIADDCSSPLKSLDLIRCRAFAAADNRTSVSHPPAGRRGCASNKRNDGLGVLARLVVRLKILCRVLLHLAANLTDEHDA